MASALVGIKAGRRRGSSGRDASSAWSGQTRSEQDAVSTRISAYHSVAAGAWTAVPHVRELGLAPLYGGWEPHAQRLMAQVIQPGGVVYDIGANRGIHTLLFARLVGPVGHVYAFEPIEYLRRELMDNVALNKFENVTPVNLAASSHAGKEAFFQGHHEGAGHLADSGEADGLQLEVETITLDEFAQRAPDPTAHVHQNGYRRRRGRDTGRCTRPVGAIQTRRPV